MVSVPAIHAAPLGAGVTKDWVPGARRVEARTVLPSSGEAQEGLVVVLTSGDGDVGDRELAEGDGAGEEKVLRGGVEGDGGDAGAGDEGGEDEAVAGGSELGEEAGGGVGSGGDDVGDEGGEGGVAGGGGVAGDVGVVGGVGGDGGGSGVVGLAVGGLAGEVGGVEE